MIPTGVHQGSAEIAGPNGEQEHILVSMDAGTYNVDKATCGMYCQTCNGFTSLFMVDNPFGLGVGGTKQQTFYMQWNGGTQYNMNNSSTWSSNTTSVATVNSTGLVSGAGVGNVTISAFYPGTEPNYIANYCTPGYPPCPVATNPGASGPGTGNPRVDSISPNWGKVGTSVAVTISGAGFGSAPTVNFTGSGITATLGTVSDSSISATFTIAPNAPVGFTGVMVTNHSMGDGSAPTSDPVNFQLTPAVATPVNYHIVSESNLANGSLFFTYTWSSSTGNQADLYNCSVGESVYYPNYPSTPYTWPLPMVATPPTPNPTVLSGPGTYQSATDTNKPPDSYQMPYSAASFSVTQRWWWSCSNYNNGATQTLAPDITITRRVFKDADGFWKYQITKGSYTNTVKLPNQ